MGTVDGFTPMATNDGSLMCACTSGPSREEMLSALNEMHHMQARLAGSRHLIVIVFGSRLWHTTDTSHAEALMWM